MRLRGNLAHSRGMHRGAEHLKGNRLIIVNNLKIRFDAIAEILALLIFIAGCASIFPQPDGHIAVHVVSWPLVKKLAEPDAGLAGQHVMVINAANGSVVAEKDTDASGDALFDLPPGSYQVIGVGNDRQTIDVASGATVKLKLVKH
jgi:hypothetical protein